MKQLKRNLDNQSDLNHCINTIRSVYNNRDKKQKIEVVIQNAKTQRTIKMNALFHALFRDISIEAMNLSEPIYLSPNGWKHFFKMNMLASKELVQVFDNLVRVPQSTTKLTIKTGKNFITDIMEWCKAMDMEVYIKTKDYDELFK